MDSDFLNTCSYTEQEMKLQSLPGRRIRAQFDESYVVLYQACSPEVAETTVRNGYFGGSEKDKWVWFKVGFLWTMYTSDWATLVGRESKERVLAIKVGRDYFVEMLDVATSTGEVYQTPPGKIVAEDITVQWKQDFSIDGEMPDTYTLAIGLKSYMMKKFNNKYIETIEDITDFVAAQRDFVDNKDYANVEVPVEDLFVPEGEEMCRLLMLDDFYTEPEEDVLEAVIEIESLRRSKFNRKVALFFQGTFNPIHTKHVQLLVECRQWLERKGERTVVAAFMGVNKDQIAEQKIKTNENGKGLIIKSKHRMKMCELAVASHTWVHVHDMNFGKPTTQLLEEKLGQPFGNKVEWYVVLGADRGLSMCRSGLNHALIMGRAGMTDAMKSTYAESTKKGTVKENVHVIPKELDNVSSTTIRKHLKNMSRLSSAKDKEMITNALIEKGWLTKCIGEYLIENEQDLYIPTQKKKMLSFRFSSTKSQ